MNTLSDTARSACFSDGSIIVSMESGAEIRFAVADNKANQDLFVAMVADVEFAPGRQNECDYI